MKLKSSEIEIILTLIRKYKGKYIKSELLKPFYVAKPYRLSRSLNDYSNFRGTIKRKRIPVLLRVKRSV